jgi:hypothetical protein
VANPKGQSKKTAVKDKKEAPVVEETPEVKEEIQEETKEEIKEEATVEEQIVRNPLDGVMGQAQRAYSAYMAATREVSRIYRENEIQVGEAYMRAVQQANETWESILKDAAADLAEAQQQAREANHRALAEAENSSREKTDAAIKEREETIAKAWELREETVAQAWEIYSKVVR